MVDRKHRKSRILNPPNNNEFIRSVSVPADRMISKSTAPFNPVTPVTPDLEYVSMNQSITHLIVIQMFLFVFIFECILNLCFENLFDFCFETSNFPPFVN